MGGKPADQRDVEVITGAEKGQFIFGQMPLPIVAWQGRFRPKRQFDEKHRNALGQRPHHCLDMVQPH